MKYLSLCAGLVLLLACACEDAGAPSDPSDLGTFSYVAFDTSGTPIVRGVLILHAESTKVAGSWQFDDGRSGELAGRIGDGTMTLDLNPGWVDDNLLLHGRITSYTYLGEWEQVGFAGVMARGTFSAIKK